MLTIPPDMATAARGAGGVNPAKRALVLKSSTRSRKITNTTTEPLKHGNVFG